ncbi:MAG: hypothetical protein Q8O67_05545 [Deltaproteobacteria bacterium]|nr:hypothetical protein [Deltaproteobacteria bacterium]
MDKRLKGILKKVAAQQALDPEDLSALKEFVDDDDDDGAGGSGGPMPLWFWVRRQFLLNQRWLDFYLDDNVDPVLLDAGAEAAALPPYAHEYRPFAMVSFDGLLRGVRRHLNNEDAMRRAYATRLVGLCRLQELVPLVVESLSSGREERQNWGLPVIAAGLECLAMLKHERAKELCRKYLGHGDYQIRRAAAMCLLTDTGPNSLPMQKDEVAVILDRAQEIRLIDGFSPTLKRAVVAGTLGEEDLERLLTDLYGRPGSMAAFADMVLTGEMKNLYGKLLEHADWNIRAAAAAAAAWTTHTWAAPLLLARLGDDDVEQVKMVLVAAIGSFGATAAGAEYDSFIDGKLDGQNAQETIGAIWSGLAKTTTTTERRARLAKLCEDPSFEVRRAASAALSVVDGDADLIELKWCELLNIEDWWPWAIPLRGLRAACASQGKPLPRAVRSFLWIADEDISWDEAAFAELEAFYKEHPQQLLRWLNQDAVVGTTQRTRAARYAGLVGGEVMKNALEQALLATTSQPLALEVAQELACLGGPRTAAGRLKVQVSIGDRAKAGPEDLLATVAFSLAGDTNVRRRAAGLLKGMGAEAEPYVLALVADADAMVAQAAADATAQMPGLTDPFLQDTARLLNSEVRALADLNAPERLVSSRSPKVKQALCELCAVVPEKELAARFLVELAADRDENVAAAATAGLGTVFAGAPWVSRHVLQSSFSDGWRAREAAFQAMAQVGDPIFLPRLLDVIGGTDEHLKNLAIAALERVADKNADRGLLVLDIRDPYRVRERYGLDVQVNYDADQQSEGLRLLLLGLEKRKDGAEITKHKGRQVMLVPKAAEAATSSAWDRKLFESLAMHLKVTYTDEDSGSIVAEVAEDPTGEVLSALLQSNTVCAITIGWS